MEFDLPEQTKALKSLVRRLVDTHQMPLEQKLLRGETIAPEDLAPGRAAAKAAGLWGLGLPKEFGGADLSTLDNVVIAEENERCLVPLAFGGRAPGFLLRLKERQKEKYLYPVLKGEKRYAFAQTEPSGGSDPGGQICTTATRSGDGWVISGSKTFISRVAHADFFIVVALTDPERRQHGGITLFLVDRDAPGVTIGRAIPMLGARTTHEIFFDNVEVSEDAVVGKPGSGFASAQRLLSKARMNIGAKAVGIAERCVEMMIAQAKSRVAFGEVLARKQAVQATIVDSLGRRASDPPRHLPRRVEKRPGRGHARRSGHGQISWQRDGGACRRPRHAASRRRRNGSRFTARTLAQRGARDAHLRGANGSTALSGRRPCAPSLRFQSPCELTTRLRTSPVQRVSPSLSTPAPTQFRTGQPSSAADAYAATCSFRCRPTAARNAVATATI